MTALNRIPVESHPFLEKEKPLDNLKLLSELKSSKYSVMTESVYQNMPKRQMSSKLQREITLLTSSVTAFSGLALIFRSLMNLAVTINANRDEELNIFGIATIAQNYLLSLSALTLSVVGVFAATRSLLHDKSLEKRFEELDREYTKIAEYLEQNSETKEQREIKRDICRKILENIPEIHASLQHFARLNSAQADYLTRKLSHAVSRNLSRGTL